jgi:hypothetical protein
MHLILIFLAAPASLRFADLDGYCWEVAWAPMCSFDETGALVFK